MPAALPGAARDVALRSADGVARLPAWSAAEALAQVPGVEVRQRQLFGAQADVSIRGSTFEQVQVLLDGADAGDPQTGHHALNLPLAAADIGRLEVLRGHGSVLLGGGSFGGTVNVVPAVPRDRRGGVVAVSGGEAGTWSARGALDLPGGGARTRLSVERARSDGDRPGTDAGAWSATARAVAAAAGGEANLFVGWARREFGALDFYAPFPSWERTTTLYGLARWRGQAGGRLTLEPRLAVRRHADRFVLVRDDPERYANEHVTRSVGADLRAALAAGDGFTLAAALETAFEDIRSEGVRTTGGSTATVPALGEHERRRLGAALELDRRVGALRGGVGARVDLRDATKARVGATAALAWDVAAGVVARASAGSVFRLPTFTELYYQDPANAGNAALAPERGWAWDGGAEWRAGGLRLASSWFERRERDVIDWVRPAGTAAAWTARNIGAGATRGLESEAAWTAPQGHVLAVRHAWLDRTRDLPAGLEAKYSQLAPRQLVAAEAFLRLPRGLGATLAARWREGRAAGDAGAAPPEGAGAVILDAKLTWRLAPWTLTVQGTNLTDRLYAEVPGVPLPGRLLAAGAGREF